MEFTNEPTLCVEHPNDSKREQHVIQNPFVEEELTGHYSGLPPKEQLARLFARRAR